MKAVVTHRLNGLPQGLREELVRLRTNAAQNMAQSDRLKGLAFQTRPPLTDTTQDASQALGRPVTAANAPASAPVDYGSLTDDQLRQREP